MYQSSWWTKKDWVVAIKAPERQKDYIKMYKYIDMCMKAAVAKHCGIIYTMLGQQVGSISTMFLFVDVNQALERFIWTSLDFMWQNPDIKRELTLTRWLIFQQHVDTCVHWYFFDIPLSKQNADIAKKTNSILIPAAVAQR